jgi:hypothetical protein
VAPYKALERRDVDRHQLVLLGNKLKTALDQRPREELRAIVEKAESIHNKSGLEASLAHLHGELEPKPTAPDKAPMPVKTRKIGAKIFEALEDARFSGKPSEKLAELERILGRNQPKKVTRGLVALLTRRQEDLLRIARKSGKVETMARTISTLSKKTNVPVEEVKAKLLEVLDKVHEMDEDQPMHVNSIFAKLAETNSIQSKGELARALKIFRNSTSRLDRKMKAIKAKTGATEMPAVFAEVLALINDASENKPIPLGNLATIIAGKVKRYELNAGVNLEEVEQLDLEPDKDTV